jgi:hypothetical protein
MYKFTEEEINKILMSSPMVLPDNPAQYGLKGNNIKSYFYDFIRKLMVLLNEHFVLIERDKAESILNHDENETSHNDIRKIISDLHKRDTELGNMIANHYSEINLSHDEIKAKIASDILSHSIDKYAHNDLRFEFSEVKTMATNALNFAQGKSKIYPVKDIFEMTNKLSDEMNVGDKFVLLDKNVPDFTLFEKNATEGGTVFTQVDLLMGNVEFLPGESYIYSGYLLVASESGVDTSMLVKNEDFELLELIVSQLDLELENAVKEKLIKTSLEASVTLKATGTELEFINAVKDELAAAFIVSQVNVVADDTATELKVTIEKAQGEKCERRWAYSETVGNSTEHPTLCARCAGVIG